MLKNKKAYYQRKIDLLKRQTHEYLHKKKRKKKRKKIQKRKALEKKRIEKKRIEIKKSGNKSSVQKPFQLRYQQSILTGNKLMQIILTGTFLAILYIAALPKIEEEVTIEAGSRLPEISSFLLIEYNKGVCYTENWDELLDFHTVDDYDIKITIRGKEYHSILHVTDTVAPKVHTKDVQIYKDDILQPMDFIESMEDATKTSIDFEEMPDFSMPGEQKVKITVIDEGGNTTVETAELLVIEDLEPPVIDGVEELTTVVGGSISYKKHVTVSDNYTKHVTLHIDSSEVDLNTVGNYTVTYSAEDEVGNVTEEQTIVHVKPATVDTATEEMVNKKADEILAQITTDGMSQYEIAKTIFNWVHSNVGWSDGTPKTNWIQGAYRGLFSRRGDCFVYASTSKCLLTRAGIANMDIGFSNPRRTHYWNLIDLGEGWYHFDTTKRTDGRSFFYYHDADIRAYSDTHNGSHAYDASKYPKIQ